MNQLRTWHHMQGSPMPSKKGVTELFFSHPKPQPHHSHRLFETLNAKDSSNCNAERRKQAGTHTKACKSLTEFTPFGRILIKRHLEESFLFDPHHLCNAWTTPVRHVQTQKRKWALIPGGFLFEETGYPSPEAYQYEVGITRQSLNLLNTLSHKSHAKIHMQNGQILELPQKSQVLK